MATTETFSTMLKRYMPHQLLVEEMKKRNYLWSMIEKDEKWLGGRYEVPFLGAEASSTSFGALTAANDIAEESAVLGYIDAQPELWGTMIFNEKDLDRQIGLEASFLKILPDSLKRFSDRMAQQVSLMVLKGHICKVTADGTAGGTVTVDHPEFLAIGEKVVIDDSDSTTATGYVRTIDMNTKQITIYDARSAGSVVDLSAYTAANSAKIYPVGTNAAGGGFTSLRSVLLSAANGGSANVHNQAKTGYPFLQAQNISGSDITAANILEKCYDAFFEVRALGKGMSNEMWMSYKNFKNIIKGLELNRDFVTKDKAAGYGFNSVTLIGADGSDMKIVAIREMDDSDIFIIDKEGMLFAGNNFFERKRHMNNEEFYMTRATTGYNYIVDIKFFGDLVVKHPSHMGIIHSISY